MLSDTPAALSAVFTIPAPSTRCNFGGREWQELLYEKAYNKHKQNFFLGTIVSAMESVGCC